MKNTKIQDQVYALAEPVVSRNGFELVGVEYVKEGAGWYLRLYIDREGGVDLDDCQKVSEEISDLLDRYDLIPQAYFLEVSSPGIERVIQREKDFERFRGNEVNISLYSPFEGRKTYAGSLGIVDEKTLYLTVDGDKIMEIPRDKIAQVRLAWQD